jgi:hypothetical protein
MSMTLRTTPDCALRGHLRNCLPFRANRNFSHQFRSTNPSRWKAIIMGLAAESKLMGSRVL